MKIANSTLIKVGVSTALIASVGFALYFALQSNMTDRNSEVERYSIVQRRIDENHCPKCNGQMENGFIVDHGHTYSTISTWVQGTPKADLNGVNTEPGSPVVTMRCKACGFLESYAK